MDGARLLNISARSLIGLNDNIQIGKFVITRDTAKAVVIRASGPALNASFEFNLVVSNPIIELRDEARDLVASNDDWEFSTGPRFAGYLLPIDPYFKRTGWVTTVELHFVAVGAFPWLDGSRDSAIVTSLNPGLCTVIVRGRNGGTGLALVKIYALP